MNHLFLHSDLASNIWSHFSSAGLPLEGNSITAFIYNAANSAQLKSAYGLLTLAVIGYGCWNIWRARNSMRYEEKILHKRRVLYQTLSQIKTVCVNANLKEDDACKRQILDTLGISAHSQNGAQLKIVKWLSPPWPFLKLNSDGACKSDGISGGGGVIRDHSGNVLLAYSHFYGKSNSLVAETRALLDGIKYLHTITNQPAILECDSQVLVRVITKEYKCPWSILSYVRRIWRATSQHDKFAHTYREGNKVADSLASLACSSKCNIFFNSNELPSFIKGEARMDKLGFPSIRLM